MNSNQIWKDVEVRFQQMVRIKLTFSPNYPICHIVTPVRRWRWKKNSSKRKIWSAKNMKSCPKKRSRIVKVQMNISREEGPVIVPWIRISIEVLSHLQPEEEYETKKAEKCILKLQFNWRMENLSNNNLMGTVRIWECLVGLQPLSRKILIKS